MALRAGDHLTRRPVQPDHRQINQNRQALFLMLNNDAAQLERAADALHAVSSYERTVWINMGTALKREFGDLAKSLWLNWSQSYPHYQEKHAETAWRSIKPVGAIGISHLYRTALDNGWQPPDPQLYRPTRYPTDPEVIADLERTQERDIFRNYILTRAAAYNAELMIKRAQRLGKQNHPYLRAKGFRKQQGLVRNNKLHIPMISYDTVDQPVRTIRAVQTINTAGQKLFEPRNCQVSNCVYPLPWEATDGPLWWCEGYATGLSIRAALLCAGRTADRVLVAFSAANMARLAARAGRGYVIADHDLHRCLDPHCRQTWDAPPASADPCPVCRGPAAKPTGLTYAQASNRPWWQPPDPGDANDFHRSHGLQNLGRLLSKLQPL